VLIVVNLPDSVTDSADAVKVHFSLWPNPSRPWGSLVHSLARPGPLALTRT